MNQMAHSSPPAEMEELLSLADQASRRRPAIKVWASALRIHQWSKNFLFFVSLILGQEFNWSDFVHVSIGVVIFSLMTSATYLFNDVRDVVSDRSHPTKRRRPLAANEIHVGTALGVGILLLLASQIAAFVLMPNFGIAMLGYVLLTLAYSLWLKREPMFDVFTIGVLFTIRLVAGMILLSGPISLWLSTFSFTFFMSLAMAKRHSELTLALRTVGVLPKGRGYQSDDLELTRTFGIGCALIAFLIMVLYFQFHALATGLYDDVEILYFLPVAVFAWSLRIWMKAHRGVLMDDPVIFALKDRVSWAYGACVAIAWLIAIKT